MLEFLKRELNKTYTENGASAYASTKSDCLDLFASIGALRNASEEDIVTRFKRAYAEDKDLAMKVLFFARDIRGGLGERRVFRVILRYLADYETGSVLKNIENVAEYGRFDDLLSLLGTPAENELFRFIEKTLKEDTKAFLDDPENANVSLLAKWLPSVNTSNKETVLMAKKLAPAIGMTDKEYRKTLSALRARIKIIENNLRTRDYSFDYEKQPSKALFKYRQAFFRNDKERYQEFLKRAEESPSVMHTGTLTPYDIIAPVISNKKLADDERYAMDVTWKALPDYADSDNSLVVVDGSGSMYFGCNPLPAAVAQSLGIYFAERNKGVFHDHFITFSNRPRLIEIKGEDIVEKVRYCMSFNECSNTDLEKTFDLILETAVINRLAKENMPEKLYIISDMEFDCCSYGKEETIFETAKMKYQMNGYTLPEIIFWNVNSRNIQQPVKMNDLGVALVSGCNPQIFSMLKDGNLEPYRFMISVLSDKRYERIVA